MGEARRRQEKIEKLKLQKSAQKTPGQLVPPGVKVLAFISPAVDCCVEKIVQEMSLYWQQAGYWCIVVNEKRCREALNYMPTHLINFRTATKSLQPAEVHEIANFTKYMKNLGCRTIYYIDDFLWDINKQAPVFIANQCNEVIVATDVLKDYFAELNTSGIPISVVKTHMDIPTFDSLPKSPLVPEGYFNIIFSSGGRIGTLMLTRIIEYMNNYPEKYKNVNIVSIVSGVAQIRSVINRFRNIKKVYYEWMSLASYYSVIKTCNLVLSPGEIGDLDYMVPKDRQQKWLDAKSCLKYNLAGAASIPCIASRNMAEYAKAIKHMETGFLADNLEEWMNYIDLCIEDKEKAIEIGKAARKDIIDNYHVSKRSKEMLEAFEGKASKISQTKTKIWLPPIAGGPRTFHDTLEKYLPIISNGECGITDKLDRTVKGAIVVAFVGAEEVIKHKAENPNLKYIARLDGLPFDFEGNIHKSNLDAMLKSIAAADIIVYQSEFCKKIWQPYLSEIKTPQRIIYNGVDLEIFNPKGEKFPLSAKFNVLHVNYSTFKHKRIDLLEDLIKAHPEVEFTLIGHYLDPSIINDMEKWGKYSNVNYMGPMKDYSVDGRKRLASIYRAANVLLFTSNHEGCPNSVLEATACGVPIIYNDEINIVPELLGKYCIAIKDFDWKSATYNHFPFETYANKYSAEKMARAYLEIVR